MIVAVRWLWPWCGGGGSNQQGEYGGGGLVVPAMAFFPVWEKIDFLDLLATSAL